MIEMLSPFFSLYGVYVAVAVGGTWLFHRVRTRAAEDEQTMRDAAFTRSAQLFVRRVR
jgi:hypothetical protein